MEERVMKKNMLISLAILGVTNAVAYDTSYNIEQGNGERANSEMMMLVPTHVMAINKAPMPMPERYGRERMQAPSNTLTVQERAYLERQLQELALKRNSLYSEYQSFMPKVVQNKFAGPMTVLQKKTIESAQDFNLFKKIVTPSTDITTPYGEYTLLMQVASLDVVKYLVNECRADINEAVWQNQWGHYVTALDCFNYSYTQSPSTVTASVISFLKQVGAKTAGQLGFWSIYFGDYVVSSQLPAIEDVLSEQKMVSVQNELAQVSEECEEIEFKLRYFTPENFREPLHPSWGRKGMPSKEPINTERELAYEEYLEQQKALNRSVTTKK